MARWVWQHEDWGARLRWDADRLLSPLASARRQHGALWALASQLGFAQAEARVVEALTDEAVTTSAIEGELFDRETVRSSVVRRLGASMARAGRRDRRADGLVEVLLDATGACESPLTATRLQRWQAALFPMGESGLRTVEPGRWRTATEPMQVVSGRIGREHVHFEAPPSRRVAAEMRAFLRWWNKPPPIDGLIRAGVAHFWFGSIHPFDDGNGRIARAIGEMALSQDERSSQRLYSVSRQIAREREGYYEALERDQRGRGDITGWLAWFLGCVERALSTAVRDLDLILGKARFWSRFGDATLSDRQRKVINRLLDAGPHGFEGGMTTRNYAALTSTSRATAQRELSELVAIGMLTPRPGGGRSSSYDVVWPASSALMRPVEDAPIITASEPVVGDAIRRWQQQARADSR